MLKYEGNNTNVLLHFNVLSVLLDLSVSSAGNIAVTQEGFQLSSCLLEIEETSS